MQWVSVREKAQEILVERKKSQAHWLPKRWVISTQITSLSEGTSGNISCLGPQILRTTSSKKEVQLLSQIFSRNNNITVDIIYSTVNRNIDHLSDPDNKLNLCLYICIKRPKYYSGVRIWSLTVCSHFQHQIQYFRRGSFKDYF